MTEQEKYHPLIYGLVDPRDGLLRYIGKSSLGLERAYAHKRPSYLQKDTSYCGNWIRSLLKNHIKYQVVIIQIFNEKEILDEAERHWIKYFKALGFPLTNLTEGGDGRSGFRKLSSDEEKEVVQKYTEGRSQQQLADLFNTSQRTIHLTLRRLACPSRTLITSHGGATPEQELEIVKLYNEGISVKSVAQKTKLQCSAIRGVLRRYDILMRPSPVIITKINTVDRVAIIQKRTQREYKGNKGMNKLAIEYGVSSTTIYRILRKVAL